MAKMVVSVLMEPIGLEAGVKHMDVLEEKLGMDQNVFVNQATTTMEVYVYFVSMDRSGTQSKELAIVQETMFGMATSVRSRFNVLGTEFGMIPFSNVYVQTNISGMGSAVWSNPNAAAERYGMKPPSSVIVLITSTGMVPAAFYV